MLISLLFQNPMLFLMLAGTLIVSISVHEFAHAYIANKLGDPTPKAMGRVTLNPKAHLDPMGTLLLLVAGFGWGRPVMFDPTYLKNPKRDAAIISFAGPASNFLLAVTLAWLINFLPREAGLASLFQLVVYYNLVLGIFNLIPLHPLDGFKVVYGLLPAGLAMQWMQMAPYGIWILLFLVFTRATGAIINPVLDFAMRALGL